MPVAHPPEFRRRAVTLARERATPLAEIAKDLRISESCLRNWLSQDEVDENGGATDLTSQEKKELVELRRDKRRLEMEGSRSSNAPPRTSRVKTSSQTSLPAGPRTCRRPRHDCRCRGGLPGVERVPIRLLRMAVTAGITARSGEYVAAQADWPDPRGVTETYGSPRVHAELVLGLGLAVNLKRVARLMREAGIQGLYRRRRRGCTVRDPDASPSPDLVTARSPSTARTVCGSPTSPSIPP